MIVEKVMHKQYKVSYGDNQYTKVTTSNMVPAYKPDTEDNPEDINVTTESIEDTGLTQQLITVNPTLTPKRYPRYKQTRHRSIAMDTRG